MNAIRWVFGFLFFHRKIIVGGLLIFGLIYWLLNTDQLIQRYADFRGEPEQDVLDSNSPIPESPKNTGEGVAEPEIKTLSIESDVSTSLDLDLQPQPIKPTSSTGLNSIPPGNPTEASSEMKTVAPSTVSKTKKEIKSESIDELIQQLVTPKNAILRQSKPLAFIGMSQRKDVAERLLEMKLSKTQLKFVTSEYLTTLSLLDSLNSQGQLGDDSARIEMIEKVEPYLDHDDQSIRSLAHLIFAVYHGYDFLERPSEVELDELAIEFDKHFDETIKTPVYATKLAEIVVHVWGVTEYREQSSEFVFHALDRFNSVKTDHVQDLYLKVREQVLFRHLDLPTLVTRMQAEPNGFDEQINELFDGLESTPDSRLEIHQIALDVVRELIRANAKQRASEMMQRIKTKIAPQISDEAKQNRLLAALREFERFL